MLISLAVLVLRMIVKEVPTVAIMDKKLGT
jgi:hypothetical protein